MSGAAYIDASAIVKLLRAEDETPALERDLAGRSGVLASRLIAVECPRALARAPGHPALQRFEDVVQSLVLINLDDDVLARAATLTPPRLRTLDAIHLASALSIREPDLDFITYDHRLAEAARASGLRVVQPGL